MTARTIDSPLGPVRLHTDRWPQALLVVDVPGTLRVALSAPDSRAATLVIGGEKVPLSHPGHWTLRRASRRIRAVAAGRRYELHPTGARRSRLVRDGAALAEVRGGWASYRPIHLWLPGRDARVTWLRECDAVDVAVGHALVIGYGAGSPGFVVNLLYAVLNAVS